MKDKILKEALNWYDNQDEKPDVFIEDFVDIIIDKTTDALIEEVREANGKKRLYIPEKIRSEVIKSVKVRVRGQKKDKN